MVLKLLSLVAVVTSSVQVTSEHLGKGLHCKLPKHQLRLLEEWRYPVSSTFLSSAQFLEKGQFVDIIPTSCLSPKKMLVSQCVWVSISKGFGISSFGLQTYQTFAPINVLYMMHK